ncbi:zinc ribbon domain-containing protein [Streptomyces sp. NPDC092129]|uniref:zinc ribbon domain-containing protein n=1 Tax=Streptomyces sp. NPDC092129 TaxID=3366010 RepID=UPI0037F23512
MHRPVPVCDPGRAWARAGGLSPVHGRAQRARGTPSVHRPRDQRARQSSWPFHQLGAFIAYKAKRAGVPFIEVDPAYTLQLCPRCGHTGRANRRTRDHFHCRRCGLAGPADHVAGVNIATRGATAWVFVNMPAPVPA